MCDSDSDEVEYEPEVFQLGDYKLEITTIAFMPLTKLMHNRDQEKEISGQKLWCGSLCVVNYLFQHLDYVKDKYIVELGAGTGVVSMIASKLSAIQVYATDHDQLSIDHMKLDCQNNHISNVEVMKLDWFAPECPVFDSNCQLRILAGDVLYKAALLQPFFTTVKTILTLYSDSELLLCHIPRAGVEQQMIVEFTASMGLLALPIAKEEWNEGSIYEYCPQEDLIRAQIYRITLLNK